MARFTTRPEILGTFGVVTSTHWLASAVGMAVLEKGGNAFDAAVATGFALQVVEPHLNGPGGEVPIILAPRGGEVKVICGQGVAPMGATLEAYRELGLNIVPGSGLLSAVVPGAFDSWMILLRDYGTMGLRDVMQYALGYAQNGYPLVPNISNMIGSMKGLFEDEWTTSADVYLPNGQVPQAGSLFKNTALAAMYERLISEAEAKSSKRDVQIEAARAIWRKGFVADTIDRFCATTKAMDTSGRHHSGFLNGDDLARWEATYEAPLTYDYHGYSVCKTGPWGQGPVFLQQLALLKHFDLSGLDENSPEFVHLAVEATKLAFADREAFYGDPNVIDVPMEILLSDDYNSARAKLIEDTASMEIRPGVIEGYDGKVIVRLKGQSGDGGGKYDLGEPTVARFEDAVPDSSGATRGDTCHFDIIDQWGNMVTATPSGGWLQSSPIIPELGFCLSNRAQMFWLDPKSPARLEPGIRPRTTLTPTLALRDGEPYMAFGTPGGDQQDQWSLHMFLRHIHFGLNLQEAIDAPGFSTAHFPGSFFPRECDLGHLAAESRFPEGTLQELKRRGHKLLVDEPWALGRMTAATRDGDLLKAAANPRFMQGYAVGR